MNTNACVVLNVLVNSKIYLVITKHSIKLQGNTFFLLESVCHTKARLYSKSLTPTVKYSIAVFSKKKLRVLNEVMAFKSCEDLFTKVDAL